jgi:signal transduction histidine kinase
MRGQQLLRWKAALAFHLRSASTYTVDTALAAAVAVPVSVQFNNSSPGGPTPLGVLLNVGTVVPLIWRRRAPFAVAVTVATFAVLVSAYHRPGQDLQYGGLVVTYTVADLGRRWQRWAFLGSLILVLVLGGLLVQHYDAADWMLTLLLPLSAYLLGTLARISRGRSEAQQERADQLARGREGDAARAAADERARIARDMHDLLAHAVSIMVVQAEAAPLVLRTDPDRAERAFDAIAEAGRDAMVQLRRMLGVLKEEHDAGVRSPPPTVAGIPALVAHTESTSLRVDLRTEGQPCRLPADAEVAAYRIVQEALTNTVRHAGARSAAVRLAWTDADLLISITDDGRGMDGAVAGSQTGWHGLIGIRERAAACGGSAESGPAPAGGFQVTARLPYTERGGVGTRVPPAGASDGRSGPAVAPCLSCRACRRR